MNRFTETAATAAASLTLLGLGLAPAAHADTTLPHKGKSDAIVARALAAKPTTGWQSVILKTQGDLTPAHKAQIQQLGGYVYRHLPLIESAAVRVPARNLAKLAALPFVAHLSSDAQVRKYDDFTFEHSRANVAFDDSGASGAGVAVAVLDSGIDPVLDLNDGTKPRILDSKDYVNGAAAGNGDKCGHGTHVAGIIAGNGAASTGRGYYRTFYGIARRASLLDIRVLDAQGQGNVSDIIRAIDYVLDYNRSSRNTIKVRVINLSLGHLPSESYVTDPLCQAVEKAYRAGLVVVCAAGNNGRSQDTQDAALNNEGYGAAYGTISSPGNSPYVITVGATKRDPSNPKGRAHDRIATYSSRGPSRLDFVLKPDLVAPGNKVIATAAAGTSYLVSAYGTTNTVSIQEYSNKSSLRTSNTYFRLSGTSMAAPVVSGAVALMLQKQPNLSPDTVKARLMLSADKMTFPDGTADPCTFGAGYLNVPAALQNTYSAVPGVPTLSPVLAPSVDPSNPGVSLFADSSLDATRAIWGKLYTVDDLRAVWGYRAVWGNSVLVDADRAIWGGNTLDSSRAIWGKNVWFDRAVWGTSVLADADLSQNVLAGE